MDSTMNQNQCSLLLILSTDLGKLHCITAAFIHLFKKNREGNRKKKCMLVVHLAKCNVYDRILS